MPDLVREVVASLDRTQLPSRLRAGAPLELAAVRGRGHGRKAIVLVLAGGSPVLFLKTAADSGAQDLVRERAALDRLAELPDVRGRVPRALALLHLQERHVLVLSAVPGHTLLHRLRTTPLVRRTAARGLRDASSWLEAFQQSTRLPGTRRLPLVEAVDRYRAGGSGFSDDEVATLDRLRAVASKLDGLELPVTGGHGDFWPGNLLLDGAATGVVDWEHFEPAASPLTDLWFLLLSTAHAVPGARRGTVDADEAFSRAFLQPGWYSDLVLAVTRRHLQSLGLPAEAAEVLLFMELLERAERTRAVQLAPVGPAGGSWSAHARAMLGSGGSLLRHV